MLEVGGNDGKTRLVVAAPFVLFHRLQLERDNNAVADTDISTFERPARGVILTRPRGVTVSASARVYLHLSTSALLVSAQAMGDYTTEATELVETYGSSPLSSGHPS